MNMPTTTNPKLTRLSLRSPTIRQNPPSSSSLSAIRPNASTGHSLVALRCRNPEQADLGRGVEAESEQESDRIHLPGAGDDAEQRAENPGNKPASRRKRADVIARQPLTAAHALEGGPDFLQDKQIGDADHEEKQRRDHCTEQAPNIAERVKLAAQRRGRRSD